MHTPCCQNDHNVGHSMSIFTVINSKQQQQQLWPTQWSVIHDNLGKNLFSPSSHLCGYYNTTFSLISSIYWSTQHLPCKVRPLLEYNSLIESPRYVYIKDKIESVQRRFTRRLKGFGHVSYAARLDHLKAETLDLCRVKSDLTTMFSSSGQGPLNRCVFYTQLTETDFDSTCE